MKKQLAALRRLGAPDDLISHFSEKVRINEGLDEELRVGFPRLLEEACRECGFQDILPNDWFFRPHAAGGEAQRSDSAPTARDIEAAAIEQAYRRGFVQGFSECRNLVEAEHSLSEILSRENALQQWRVRSVQRFRSRPGEVEKPPKALFGGRAGVSARLRYEVLKADAFRCRLCGNKSGDGVRLEVDHITPYSLGGSDELENLQTLCNLCNAGKSNRP